MQKKFVIFFIGVFILSIVLSFKFFFNNSMSGAPPYGEAEDNTPSLDNLSWLNNWKRPEGPAKVALQAGHWKNSELPDELERLRGSSGSSGGGKAEWEVNLAISEATAEILEEKGITVEILPATVPPAYWADVFVAIHADGSTDVTKKGFKVASPWRDYTRNADELVSLIENSYKEITGLAKDENITRNMRGYYAFSWWRHEHAIHPMTTAAIIETGFLTNYSDRRLLINLPEIPAQAIAEGIINYLGQKNLL